MERKDFYYRFYMSQFKGKGPARGKEDIDGSAFVGT